MSDVPPVAPRSLTVFITREPWTDFFILHVPDGKGGWHPQEELDVDDTYEWFLQRGANKIRLEKALDHIWNFNKGAFEIENYREPPVRNPRLTPKID
jgi:hypothetical protein